MPCIILIMCFVDFPIVATIYDKVLILLDAKSYNYKSSTIECHGNGLFIDKLTLTPMHLPINKTLKTG